MKQIDLQFVKDTLSELDPSLEGSEQDESYLTALVVISALVYGPDTERLAKFTELPREFVETIRQRMIRAGLWTEIEVFCDHWFVEEKVINTTALWIDVLIAQGLVVRHWDEEVGQYRYWDAAHAPNKDPSEERVN